MNVLPDVPHCRCVSQKEANRARTSSDCWAAQRVECPVVLEHLLLFSFYVASFFCVFVSISEGREVFKALTFWLQFCVQRFNLNLGARHRSVSLILQGDGTIRPHRT